MTTILLVDDERSIVETIRYNLKRDGYEVVVAMDGEEAVAAVRQHRPDLVLLDVMLPKIDGFEVCRILRRQTSVPIFMLTARGDEVDRVVGLEIGADDYITKPFSYRELLARIRAALRRAHRNPEREGEPEERFVADGLVVEPSRHEASVDGQPVRLRPKEFELLVYLLRHRGHVLTRHTLLQNLWGYEFDGGTRTVDVHVRGLREKIESDPAHPKLIETIRGVGYRFRS